MTRCQAALGPAAGSGVLCAAVPDGSAGRWGAVYSRRAYHRLCNFLAIPHSPLPGPLRPAQTGITAYDVRHIETSADETDDANWAVEGNAWTSGTLQYTITMLDQWDTVRRSGTGGKLHRRRDLVRN